MLSADKYRPKALTYVFEPNIDIPLIEKQLKARSSALAKAIDNNKATISWQAPTQSMCCGLLITVSEFYSNAEELLSTIKGGAQSLGVKLQEVEVDIPAGKIAFLLESYEPSAIVSQTKHKITDLPA